jgi:hypothetical protein
MPKWRRSAVLFYLGKARLEGDFASDQQTKCTQNQHHQKEHHQDDEALLGSHAEERTARTP